MPQKGKRGKYKDRVPAGGPGIPRAGKRKDPKKNQVNPNPATPENQTRTKGPICGAKRRSNTSGPGVCCQPAGWGTTHVGVGQCKLHGGSTPSGVMAAQKAIIRSKMPTYGNPIEVGPHQAILEEVHRTAGHVQWLFEMIQWLGRSISDDSITDEELEEAGILPKGGPEPALTQPSLQGIKPSVWLQLYKEERVHLVNTCKAAVTMGCAERTVKVAEDQGKLLAMVIISIFRDPRMGMNAEQIGIFPEVAREHMARVHSPDIIEVASTVAS